MADDGLVSPKRFEGPELNELLQQHWPEMAGTRARAEASLKVINGEDTFVLPETFKLAGADQYIAEIPHPRTVPARVLQDAIAERPTLSIPLGPKGLGITAQRLTTRVENPLNAICEDTSNGFQWDEMCAIGLYEGWAAGITVVDPASWQQYPSQWDDGSRDVKPGDAQNKEWAARYRVDKHGRSEDHENYEGLDHARAKSMHKMDMEIHRARNLPIKHRALSILNCAPIFGPDMSVEGLIVSQEFSTSWLRRHFKFGDAGVPTPTGGNGQDSGGSTSHGAGSLTLIEGWLYDENGIPYVSYCVKGKHAIAAEWKGGDYDGQAATINLKDRFGLDRLPVAWKFFLGNPGERNPDKRAMGLIEPFAGGWRSVRAKMTANNVAILFGSYPILIEESDGPQVLGSMEDDDPTSPDIMPMKITPARPGTRLRALEIQAVGDAAYRQIDLELGANADEAPGKSNKDQSGFSQSLAKAFEKLALTTVHNALGSLYEAHGSFTLEAGKRLPEMGKRKESPKSSYAPITVFASTDVPPTDNPGDKSHNEPMTLDPDLIDETFTCKALYPQSMGIPEKQQSMEEVARNLKTRRKHLEESGDTSPETTELELKLEAIRALPEYQKFILGLMAQVQGSEELAQIAKAKDEGLVDETGLPVGNEHGVMPAPPPGMPVPPQPGMPGVPEGGSVTGGAGPQYGPAALGGVVAGAGMTGPISNAVQAGGFVPAQLPTAGVA